MTESLLHIIILHNKTNNCISIMFLCLYIIYLFNKTDKYISIILSYLYIKFKNNNIVIIGQPIWFPRKPYLYYSKLIHVTTRHKIKIKPFTRCSRKNKLHTKSG